MTSQNTSLLGSCTPRLILSALALSATLAPALAFAQTKFIDPSPDELAMTSLPGYPGVAAVILNREEMDYDEGHVTSKYQRIKILTEEGKKYADVELPYLTTLTTTDHFNNGFRGNEKSLDDIQGRTIHPDGTIIPFTGKPYLKVIAKTGDYKRQEKVFTLPDVTVGSIIEYRYATHTGDFGYEAPVWIVQGDLYVESAHYTWYPRTRDMLDENGDPIRTIIPFPILPKDAALTHHTLLGNGGKNSLPTDSFELTIKNVPPIIDEEYMPPLSNYSYRVYFSPVSTHTGDEYWKLAGKYWSKRVNSFASPNSDLKDGVQKITAGATTEDQKLRAIYAAVMKFENTDFTREHEAREDKAAGFGRLTKADDILKRERGDSTQLAELFIAMARAAGIQAEAMLVADRSKGVFIPEWLDINQFDDIIAIVNVDGKVQYFDPGSRYCRYGHLAWQHQFDNGLRQKGNETIFEETPGDTNQDNAIFRVANLNMDTAGKITGKIEMTYIGAEALQWRQTALRGDDESLKHDLGASLEEMIPHSLQVKDVSVANADNYEIPLKVSFNVEGTIGAWTGKRLILPADLFLANKKVTFPNEKREVAVDFNYRRQTRDALRINFPSTFSVEAAEPGAKYGLGNLFAYAMTITPDATGITTRRDFVSEAVYILPDAYSQLRTFYSQIETNDQQSIILKSTTTASGAAN